MDTHPEVPASPFRHATLADLDGVLALMGPFYAEDGYPFDPEVSRRVVTAMLADPRLGQLWVVADAEGIAGYLAVTHGYSLEFRGRDAFVDELVLAERVRGQGLGRQALEVAQEHCRRMGIRALHLEVEPHREPALGLYRKTGFVDHARHLMTKILEPAAPAPPRTPPPFELRPVVAQDADSVYAAVRESLAELKPWMSWARDDYDREDARQWALENDGAWRARHAFEHVLVAPDGRLLGVCGVNLLDWPNRRANLGYWIRTSEAGQGLMTAAARQVASWALTTLPLSRLEIVIAVGNEPSRRVAEHLGAHFEGVQRNRLTIAGRALDAWMYSLVG